MTEVMTLDVGRWTLDVGRSGFGHGIPRPWQYAVWTGRHRLVYKAANGGIITVCVSPTLERLVSTPAISIRNVTKVYPIPFKRERVVAVQDLSLDVQPGQVYGLLGPNGSGKSTTMKIVLGLVTPTSGTTEIFGRESTLVESREDVGFLPENPYFYKYLTGLETLFF